MKKRCRVFEKDVVAVIYDNGVNRLEFKRLVVVFRGFVKHNDDERCRLVNIVNKVAEIIEEDDKTFVTLTAQTLNKYKLK